MGSPEDLIRFLQKGIISLLEGVIKNGKTEDDYHKRKNIY